MLIGKSKIQGSLDKGALEKQPLEKQHKMLELEEEALRVQFCHSTNEETSLERGNDLAKGTKLVSSKARSST